MGGVKLKKIQIDGRGQDCPKPVIMTKKELENIDEGTIVTIVDNKVANDNVSKLANSLGYEYESVKNSDEEYVITITKGKAKESEEDDNNLVKTRPENTVLVFASNLMGKGAEELGQVLIKSLMYTITETIPYPNSMIFYNSGVYLTCEGSEVLDDLKKLEEEGVEIISCGTCLDYYEINDKLGVGEISNMYTIYEKMRNSTNTINI